MKIRVGDMTIDQAIEFCNKRRKNGPGCIECPFFHNHVCGVCDGLKDVVNKDADVEYAEVLTAHFTNAWNDFKEQRVLGEEIYKTFCEKCSQFKDEIIDWKAVGPTSIQITLATKEVFIYDSLGDQLLYFGRSK